MKHIIAAAVFLSVSFVCLNVHGQSTDWQKTSDWKLYSIHRGGSLQYPVDSLQHFKSVALNPDSMQFFLQKMSVWPKEKTALWMGAFIASYKSGNEMHKLDISTYGGFIFDESSKQYFELPERYRTAWLDFLNDAPIR